MPKCRESKYVVHVSLLSLSHNQFRQWKLIPSFLMSLDALLKCISTKSPEGYHQSEVAYRIKISLEKKMNEICILNFCVLPPFYTVSLIHYPRALFLVSMDLLWFLIRPLLTYFPHNFFLSTWSWELKVAFFLVHLV